LLGDARGHATACHRSSELPPADTAFEDCDRSEALDRLIAAFGRRAAQCQ